MIDLSTAYPASLSFKWIKSSLVERHSNGDKHRYRYRVTYPNDSLFFVCTFNKDKKVAGFGIDPE